MPQRIELLLSGPSGFEGSKTHVEAEANNNEFQGTEVDIPIDFLPIVTQQVLVDDRGSPYGYNSLIFPDSIRLLELEPSNEVQDRICCRLLGSRIDHGSPNETLSGYWGEGSKRMPIHLSDRTYHITAEL
jgi:hypothetical protein